MYDVRIELRDLFEQTKRVISQEKALAHESVLLIGRLDQSNAAVNLGIPDREFPGRLGLSRDQFYKRVQAARVVRRWPDFFTMLEEHKTHIAHLAIVAPKITDANKAAIADFLPGKSKRELELFLSRLMPNGSMSEAEETIEIRLTLSKSELALLERAKEVLSAAGHVPTESKVLVKALETLLDARDPVRKAERAERRQARDAETKQGSAPGQTVDQSGAKRNPIPAAVKHAVFRRDGGQCTEVLPDGRRCPEQGMIEFDHIHMVCRGGSDEVDNLVLRCRAHNQASARRELGAKYMRVVKRGHP